MRVPESIVPTLLLPTASFPMKIPLTTGHSIAPLEPTDAESCVTLLKDQEVHVGLLQMPNPYRQTDFERWYEIVSEETNRIGKPLQFAIRDAEGVLIGGIGAKELTAGHKCEIGYWLGKPSWGRGLMTVAVSAFCAYLREDFQVVRITACVFVGNIGSTRVLQKNGFRHEGRMRKYYRKQGRFIDGDLFAKVHESARG